MLDRVGIFYYGGRVDSRSSSLHRIDPLASDPTVETRLESALGDRYEIQSRIGAGGMATVYLARDLKHNRQVAIKVLRPELSASLGADRFVREIEIAAGLGHPHILPLFDSGQADGLLYYVMPYVDGESLRERLAREGTFPVQDVVRLTDEIASALSYAHERGIVHRDIKPENIMLVAGRAVVTDFGVARAVSAAGSDRLTRTGLAVGTPAYMSPEQATGQGDVDGRSDVYALGCVVYEMVTGHPPFQGGSPQALLAKHASQRVPSLRTADRHVPLFLERAVDRALAKDPVERFPTADAFSAALTSEMVVARVGSNPWVRRAVVAIVSSLLLTVGGWALLNRSGGPSYERLAVLPPTDRTNDPDQAYFVEGMHDQLISELGRSGLDIKPRTAVLRFAHSQQPPREIASELGVDALGELSVFRAGDSVSLEVRLVDGRTEDFVAAPITRSGQLRNVETLFRQLAAAIATELHVDLTPEAAARLASARPVNPEALDAWLKGSFHWRRLNPEDLSTAQSYFELALEKDSSYAPAWEGLAIVWAARQQMQITHPRVAGPKAREAAERAVALDDASASAHEALAAIRTWTDWDWTGAASEWARALELDPSSTIAQAYYAHFLMTFGRMDDAVPHARRALELDPYNPLYHGMMAMVYDGAGRYEEAIGEARAALASQPDLGMARDILQQVLFAAGRWDDLVAVQRERIASDPERVTAFEDGMAEGGREEAFRRVADLLVARYEGSGGEPDPGARTSAASWRGRIFMPLAISHRFIFAGANAEAMDWIERAYEIHEPGLPYISVMSVYDPLRSDPRFQALLDRLGLPTI